MEPDVVEAGKALSPIIVAIIGAGAGLVSGVIASLIAPWVQYAIESRRKAIEYKEILIRDTRVLLDKSDTIAEIRASSLWGFINDNLSEKERKKVFPGAYTIELSSGPKDELSQDDHRKQGISNMLARLEKEWNLTKT